MGILLSKPSHTECTVDARKESRADGKPIRLCVRRTRATYPSEHLRVVSQDVVETDSNQTTCVPGIVSNVIPPENYLRLGPYHA